MPTLNRFPLFGLWNRIAAGVLGFKEQEAKCIGHGVAVLYAIRAQGGRRPKLEGPKKTSKNASGEAPPKIVADDISFGDDELPCRYDDDGRVAKCLVGYETPQDAAQTPASYDANVDGKIPPEFIEPLTVSMLELLTTYKRAELKGPLLYSLYNDWKIDCQAGRAVDVDQLLKWLKAQTKARGSSSKS